MHKGEAWRQRVGSTVVSGTIFAVVGWALSLTQGSDAQHWPWILVGALLGIGFGLLLMDPAIRRWRGRRMARPHQVDATPDPKDAFAYCDQAQRVSDRFLTEAIRRWGNQRRGSD